MTSLPIPLTALPSRLLRLLRKWFIGLPPRQDETVRAPEALAHPMSARAQRHIRNARISWW